MAIRHYSQASRPFDLDRRHPLPRQTAIAADGAAIQMSPSGAAEKWNTWVAHATGVLMAQFRLDREAAFDKLAEVASDNDRPVIDVAREIVENDGL